METTRANHLCPICPICQTTTKSPMMLSCCGYMACGKCLMVEGCKTLDRYCPGCSSTRARCRVRIDRSWEPAEDQLIESTQAASRNTSTFAGTQESVNASPGSNAKPRGSTTFDGSRKKEDALRESRTKPREDTRKRKLSGDIPASCSKRMRRPSGTQENVNAGPGSSAKPRGSTTFGGSQKKEDALRESRTKPREDTRKRKLSGDIPASCSKRMRRPSVTFIGDSQLQLFTRDHEFQLLAWEERWSLRMRRGGCVHHIANLARHYTDWLTRTSSRSSQVLVVCVGGNDVSNACKRGVDFRMVEESAEELAHILKRAARYGAQVLWIQVCPRKDIEDEARIYFNRVVGEHIAGCRQIQSVDLVGHYEPHRFVQNKLWRDDIHFGRELFTTMLEIVKEEIGLQRIPQSSRAQHFVPKEGRMCQNCGRCGHTRDRCYTYA